MPMHAQIVCIGGNALFVFFFLLGASQTFGSGEAGAGLLLVALAIAAGYSCWVLLKFRKYLSAEDSLARQVQMEQMQDELEKLKARHAAQAVVDSTLH